MTDVVIDAAEIERIIARETNTWKETLVSRKAQRALNLDPTSKRLTPAKLKDMKSDMKRTTTLLRRFREFKNDAKDNVMADVTTLNLSKFVTESAQNIVASILEGKTKLADTYALVYVCCELHQMYDKFTIELLTEIRKKWVLTAMAAPADETQDASRVRVMTKFTCELFLVGVTTEWKLFRWVLTQVAQAYSATNATTITTALSVVNIVAKTIGSHIYGAGPWPPEDPTPVNVALAKIQHSDELFVPPAACTEMRKGTMEFASACCVVLKSSNDELEDIWKQNMDAIHATGELPDAMKESFGAKKKVCDKLFAMLNQFVTSHPDNDKINLHEVPTLAKLQATLAASQANTSTSIVFLSGLASFYTVGDIVWSSEDLYDSEQQRQFYEDFDELVIPIEDTLAEFQKDKPLADDSEDKLMLSVDEHLRKLYRECKAENVPQAIQRWATVFFDSSHALQRYLIRGSKDHGKSFLMACKRRLLKYLSESPPERLEIIPGLCRLAALIHQSGETTICDAGELLGKSVEDDLYKCLISEPTHGPHELRNKLKLARILCEIVKFRTIQTGGILRLISAACEENHLKRTPHVPEVLSNILENVGTFLTRNGMTRARFDTILNNLSKTIRLMAGEYEIRIGAAITTCREALTKQAESITKEVKPRISKDSLRSPYERYLRHLLFNELSRHTVGSIASQIFKFSWEDKDTRRMVITTLRKAHRMTFSTVPHLASVIRRVSERYDTVGTWIVDDIIERCRQDLEIRLPSQRRTPQKRHVDMKLFGELCVLGVVHESTLFYVLYMVALHRQSQDMGRDFGRIRLICCLLDTVCHDILTQVTSRKRLQNFLYHFYMLVHTKQRPFPVDVNFAIGDTLDAIKEYYPMSSGIEKFPDTFADAERMMQKYMYKLSAPRGNRARDPVNEYCSFFTNSAGRTLHPITDDQFYGFDNEEEYVDAGEDDITMPGTPAAPQQVPVPDVSQGGRGSGGMTKKAQTAENLQAREDDDFDKMFKDATKESYDAVKQASSLKSMSGRRTTVNVAPQMMQLQSMLRTPEYSNSLGTVSADRSAVSVGIVLRNKDAGKGGKVSSAATSAPTVLVRTIDIPVENAITQSQKQHITLSRQEEEQHKKAVLNRVREMQRDDDSVDRGITHVDTTPKVKVMPQLLPK
jgi:regulator of nonsense transcripts 2